MSEHQSRYYQSLVDQNAFGVVWELVPGRGAIEREQERFLAAAQEAAGDGRVHAITITDNAGGNPALSAEMLGIEVGKLGIDALVHLSSYHRRPAVERRGDRLFHVDRNLLLYYRNRLAGHDLKRTEATQ